MLFNSLTFLIFCAIFFAIWPLARRSENGRWGYLTVASFIFYGWWDWRFLFLLLLSGLIDYYAALAIVRFPRYRGALLAVSMCSNLGILGLFKYWNFAVTALTQAGELAGVPISFPVHHLILPVGISFYTFQSMSYTIDVYRRELEPTRNILHFFAYLSMFPQLVAGPIVRAATLLPQLKGVPTTTRQERILGMQLIAVGFFKKTVIADQMATFVDHAFREQVPYPDGLYWWVIMTMFSLQIYCDFSGYSDIARGLAKWMGYEFPLNFNVPYIAVGFRDFWSRWHMSLSTWFRDYVYIPLGGNTKGALRGHVNMWITMMLSGIWHGANWTFLVWGALHAAYLSLERLTRWPDHFKSNRLSLLLGAMITYFLTLIAWVFFRADSMSHAFRVLQIMFWPPAFSSQLVANRINVVFVGLMCCVLAWHAWLILRGRPDTPEEQLHSPNLGWVLGMTSLLVAAVLFRGPGHAFVYFQF